ncbi:putative isomerase YbhE [Trichoderma longibrachiatum ATCC 18648]|uniref:Putative isomerase YbhE n=1 Tax=Trichoderma longibrachiatum ATCC 18648 TaxID=983965 RepID=A0A2T4C0B9_TRILO|nr:putative isomerase YbhE [Trichoderma longibrachiatum ATCC 18648]
MKLTSTLSAALAISPALAAPTARAITTSARLIYSNSGHIFLGSFNGTSLSTTLDAPVPGTIPSWLKFIPPNTLYAVDEGSSSTSLYNVNVAANTVTEFTRAQGSPGVVHLEVNKAGTRMLGAGFGSGNIDVWDIEGGGLTLLKTIPSPGPVGPDTARQASPHPHMALVLSPDSKDLYLSNRLSGQATDNIAHIKIIDQGAGVLKLLFINTVSSGGGRPRMFSISNDGNSLFVTNQDGPLGVAVISRNPQDGSLDANFTGSIEASAFGDTGNGPQFIQQIQ